MSLSRSRSLLADDLRRGDRFYLLFLAALLVGALLWASLFPLGVEVRASTAWVEPAGRAYWVAAEVSGRVVQVPLELGAKVAAGEVLLVLDSDHEREVRTAAQQQLNALEQRAKQLESELAAELDRLDFEIAASADEAAAAARQARGEATNHSYATKGLEQSERLLAVGLVSKNERLRLESEAEKSRSLAEVAAFNQSKAERRLQAARQNRLAREAALRGQLETVHGEIAEARSLLRHSEEEIERRTLRSPVAGLLRGIEPLGPGAVVAAGDKLAKVVPDMPGHKVVALLHSRYLPRLRPGLVATVREIEALRGGLGRRFAARLEAVGVPAGEELEVELVLLEDSLPVGAPVRAEIELERKPFLMTLLEGF